MDQKEILQFEPDDASKTGINGKQVFFTKRINGETIHNKELEEESMYIPEQKKSRKAVEDEELFIEFKNIHYQEKKVPQKRKPSNKKTNNKKKVNKNTKKTKSKKNRKKKRLLKVFLILIIIIGIIVFAMVSPIFNIEQIEVTGNDKIDSETIVSLSGVSEGKNIFQVSKNNVIKSIKENTYINNVSVKRILPGTLEIAVEERTVAYQIKVINSYVYINYQGYILEASSKSANVPQIEGFLTDQDILLNGKRLLNDDIESLRTILRIMETAKTVEISELISKITIKDNEYILNLKKENKTVYLGNAKNLTNQMAYVKLMLENEKGNKGIIFVNGDINSGFKPYFREERSDE